MPKGMPPPPVDRKNLSPDNLVATELSYAVEHFDYHGVQFYQLASGILATPSSAAVTVQYRRLMRSEDPQIRGSCAAGRSLCDRGIAAVSGNTDEVES
jgi:hypothetical protein